MRYAYFGFGMLLFGSIGLVIIVMMQSITINNDSEYYNLKEAMQAAMLESIDYACYRVDGRTVSVENNDCGYLLKISEQKFVDNFTRRFFATIGGDAAKYTLEFYDIIESPPKASVVIRGNTDSYGIVSGNEGFTITNALTGILELKKGISPDKKFVYTDVIDFDYTEEFEDDDVSEAGVFYDDGKDDAPENLSSNGCAEGTDCESENKTSLDDTVEYECINDCEDDENIVKDEEDEEPEIDSSKRE